MLSQELSGEKQLAQSQTEIASKLEVDLGVCQQDSPQSKNIRAGRDLRERPTHSINEKTEAQGEAPVNSWRHSDALNKCLTLHKFLNFSVPQFPICKMKG